MENLYSIEIEAGLNRGPNRQQHGLYPAAPGNRVTFAQDEDRLEMDAG